jgi:hypothetical protein
MNRLERIASLLRPCPVPDLAHGFDACPCGTGGSWPCTKTIAAWLAAGLDPSTETARLTVEAIQAAGPHTSDPT